ncbi:MAG: VWA domain-containing protein [Desulfobulbaceae bacterium]|nr:MAG: VWA domain-containing protein [Desulfobulbaceae bacterium]
METLTFGQPVYLLAGIIGVVGLQFVLRFIAHRKHQKLQEFASEPLLTKLQPMVSMRRRIIKGLLLSGALLCCFIALARPQYGHRWIDVKQKGIDILFAIDTSNSMRAEDIKPNRLERSKLAIMDFVNQLNGDRVGLMPFAGSAYLICPLTSDYHAFEHSLMAIDTSIISQGGTNIGFAITEAERVLKNDANHKILIMLTDGENLQGSAINGAGNARQSGMTIFTVGTGTEQGELIPDPEQGGYFKDEQGNYIKSRLDRRGLTEIAQTTGGFYVPLGDHGQGLEEIYQQKLTLIPKEDLQEKRKKVPLERSEWPLGLALFLVVIEFLLSGRKNSLSLSRFRTNNPSSLVSSILLLVLSSAVFGTVSPGQVYGSAGDQLYREGSYGEAQKLYQADFVKHPERFELLYNAGSAAYRHGEYEQAIESFQSALQTDQVELQEKAYYNLGNAHYRNGESTLHTNPSATIDAWEASLASYQNSLGFNPENRNALHNYQLVEKKLEQLKRLQSEQQQPEPQQQPPQNENQNEPEDGKNQQRESSENDPQDSSGDNQQKSDSPGEQADTSDRQSDSGDETDSQPTQPGDDKGNNQQNDKKQTETQQGDERAASSPSSRSEKPQMTRAQAEQLLNEMEGEEGRILDLFRGTDPPKEQNSLKNW